MDRKIHGNIYKFRKRGTLGALLIDPSLFLELFAKLENKLFISKRQLNFFPWTFLLNYQFKRHYTTNIFYFGNLATMLIGSKKKELHKKVPN